jgi:hypothetical protein
MKQLLAFSVIVLLAAACSKDKFGTKPQIRVISVSNEVVPKPNPNPTYTSILLGFTDKEGDVDSSLILVRQRLNRRNTTPGASQKFTVPEFPNKSEGEIEILLSSTTQLSRGFTPLRIPGTGNVNEPDTMKLSFVLADKAGNRSDTVATTVIVMR